MHVCMYEGASGKEALGWFLGRVFFFWRGLGFGMIPCGLDTGYWRNLYQSP